MSQPDSVDHPSKSSPKPLGQYLVEAKLLTPAHIEVALYDQRERGYRLGDILAMRGWVKEEIIEWIVQNKLLPERQVEEEDFDTLLLSLKEVLEQKDSGTEAAKSPKEPGVDTVRQDLQSMLDQEEKEPAKKDAPAQPTQPAKSWQPRPDLPPPPPPRKPQATPHLDLSDRDTLVLPDYD
jgi:hypothetical protein